LPRKVSSPLTTSEPGSTEIGGALATGELGTVVADADRGVGRSVPEWSTHTATKAPSTIDVPMSTASRRHTGAGTA
jgi:hypothetical protein